MSRICRVCRLSRVFMVPLEQNNEDVKNILGMLNNIVESNASALPNHICSPCKDRLQWAFEFKIKLTVALNAEQMAQNPKLPGENRNGGTLTENTEGRISKKGKQTNDNEKTRPFQCEKCERRFKYKENCQTHEKRHEMNLKEYSCRKCKLCFLKVKHFTDHACKSF
ncbi:vascular endothelial zinc finger 1-like [Sitodiplosis mosellana]|uniref:vascular endothelial zinc finger 1-like n=1 Tax=Sitodiplosis mosellana TaxID=263140 RepID=UPI00244463E0|nr:vascular endothelial zinc finger 1-like [Sitodiplosis mosellana]